MAKTLNDKFPKYINLFDGTSTSTTIQPSLFFYGAFSTLVRPILMDSITNNHKLCPALETISGTAFIQTPLSNLFWESMDLYLHMHYGMRTLNPQYENLKFNSTTLPDGTPTDGAKFIGYNILSIYGNKWDMLISSSGILEYITNDYKYNPLENYDKYETIDQYRQNTGDQKQEYNHYTQETGKVKTTPSGTYTDTVDAAAAYPANDSASGNGSTSQRKIKGFNSTDAVTVEENNSKNQIHQTTQRSHSNYNETVEYGADSSDRKTIVKSDTGAGDKRTDNLTEHFYTDPEGTGNHIHGNIGVMTATDMMLSIINQKSTTLVYDIICKDIADYLCLPIY